jgi:hypothetical protein
MTGMIFNGLVRSVRRGWRCHVRCLRARSSGR